MIFKEIVVKFHSVHACTVRPRPSHPSHPSMSVPSRPRPTHMSRPFRPFIPSCPSTSVPSVPSIQVRPLTEVLPQDLPSGASSLAKKTFDDCELQQSDGVRVLYKKLMRRRQASISKNLRFNNATTISLVYLHSIVRLSASFHFFWGQS